MITIVRSGFIFIMFCCPFILMTFESLSRFKGISTEPSSLPCTRRHSMENLFDIFFLNYVNAFKAVISLLSIHKLG